MPKENTLDTLEKVIKSVCCLDLSRRMYELNDFNVPLLAQAIRQLLLGEIERARVFTLNQGEKYLEQAEIKKIVEKI